jgi:hypothetical protein
MAFSNTYDTTNTGSAVSNREDLTSSLTILAPEETPVLSSASKSKANATYVEWTVDSLAAPVTTGVAEGADVSTFTDKFANRARLGNYVQKFRRDYMVSDLQNAAQSVGPANIAQAELKAIRELKRDVEATLMSENEMTVEDGAGTPYGLRGLGKWIQSTAQATNPVPASYRTPSGSIHSSGLFTETIFNNLITSIARVSGTANSLTLIADSELRRVISDFARTSGSTDYAVRAVNLDGNVAKIKLSVELYESDHGIVSIVNMNFDCAPDTANKDTGYLINPDYYGVAEFIPMGSTRLPNFGGGERGYVDTTLTLLVNHPGAHGKITDVTA